jgi:adenylyltransferase/sulfurtransferase
VKNRVEMDRYHRQTLLPFVGESGQARLEAARVLLVGCGALGSVIADQLVRAGIGHLTIADRDLVELTNLQRQVLYDEADAREGTPKALAAAARLSAVNSSVTVDPRVIDVHSGNIEELISHVDLIFDGTDNVETRYLVNDVAVKHGVPWVYGACVGVDGRVMAVRPGVGPCLRCIFESPAAVGELPTCDTAGVLGPAAWVVASLQVTAGLRVLLGGALSDNQLITIDIWKGRFRAINAGAKRDDCICCGQRRYEFLDRPVEQSVAALCGRNAVQVRAARPANGISLGDVAARLERVGHVQVQPFLIRCQLRDQDGLGLTVFGDGRAIVHGTSDLARARALVSRFLGS